MSLSYCLHNPDWYFATYYSFKYDDCGPTRSVFTRILN